MSKCKWDKGFITIIHYVHPEKHYISHCPVSISDEAQIILLETDRTPRAEKLNNGTWRFAIVAPGANYVFKI